MVEKVTEPRLRSFEESISSLPFVRACRPDASGGALRISTADGEVWTRLVFALSSARFADRVERERERSDLLHLVRGVVSREVADRARAGGVQYVDEGGGIYLDLGGRFVAVTDGRLDLPERRPTSTGLRSAGYRALFAVLAEPELVAGPLRGLAEAAGVSTTAASGLLETLAEDGALVRRGGRWRLRASEALLARWLVGYRDLVRPRLLLGRFALPLEDAASLEPALRRRLGVAWAWGGSEAARRLGGSYRDSRWTVHLPFHARADAPTLPLRPDEDGPVIVLGVPGPRAMPEASGEPAHPLLVYSELVIDPHPRAQEAALALRERFPLLGEP